MNSTDTSRYVITKKKILPAGSISTLVIALIFVIATAIALGSSIPVKQVMANYNYDVLVLLIIMELFTNLIVETGIMEFLAVKLSVFAKGRKKLSLVCFAGLMFIISALLNNITAVMMILPVVFVLLKAIEIDQKYINVFFAVILALSNTGGAASPIGDFPAVVIMTSGITSFVGYLSHAFPLFLVTSTILIAFWVLSLRKHSEDTNSRRLAVSFLMAQYKYHQVKWDLLIAIGAIFAGMFFAWSLIPQNVIPPEIIAVIGYVCAAAICKVKGIRVRQRVDMKSILLIASFLFMATVISQTGILSLLANCLKASIHDPVVLLIVIMIITSICAGIFSAGPAAAAMMPIIIELCNTTFQSCSDLVAIAYAASICAGSSLFMSSATAGFILSERVNGTGLSDSNGNILSWNIGNYLKYGFCNFAIQLTVAIAWILVSFLFLK